MSGYAAHATLQGASPRFIAAGVWRSSEPSGIGQTAKPAQLDVDDSDVIDLAGSPLGEWLAARWDDLREAWSQTTFYLFDPESWR